MWHDAVVSEQAYSDVSRPASELLRALDGTMTEGDMRLYVKLPTPGLSSSREIRALRNALPLIADVVEAAEDSAGQSPDSTYFAATRGALRGHLTALREALEALDAES